MTLHSFKIWPEPFDAVLRGDKRAEFRDVRDRDPMNVGDLIVLREYDPRERTFTNREAGFILTHVQTGFGIPDGFAMLSIMPIEAVSE